MNKKLPRPTARMTVEGYLGILQDTLLPAFELQLRVRERRHPKLYWVDSGLVRAAKRQAGPVAAEERGPLLEGWILTVLRAHNEQSHLFEEISYWAPVQARQTEVDFLLRRGKDFLAIEVKAQSRFSATQLSGLRAISDLRRIARRVLVYLGDRKLRTEEGIEVWPLQLFLDAVGAGYGLEFPSRRLRIPYFKGSEHPELLLKAKKEFIQRAMKTGLTTKRVVKLITAGRTKENQRITAMGRTVGNNC